MEIYDKIAQSLFYEMFGDPVTNEKGWKVKKVIDVVTLQRGFDLPTQNRFQEGKVPMYGSNGILSFHNKNIISPSVHLQELFAQCIEAIETKKVHGKAAIREVRNLTCRKNAILV